MAELLMPILTIIAIFIQPSYAQIARHRRVSTGRIIAGCIVGGLAVLLFLLLLVVMLRRRRSQQQFIPVNPASGSTTYGPKPMFGGPWGRSNQTNVQTNAYPNQGASYAVYTSPQRVPPAHHSPTPNDSEYPSQNAPNPPPVYEADYGHKYSPPEGPPPGQSSTEGPYNPPPGPPPAAHLNGKGQDDQFVGGFRS